MPPQRKRRRAAGRLAGVGATADRIMTAAVATIEPRDPDAYNYEDASRELETVKSNAEARIAVLDERLSRLSAERQNLYRVMEGLDRALGIEMPATGGVTSVDVSWRPR